MRHFCSLGRATILAAILATFFFPATAQQVTGSDTTKTENGKVVRLTPFTITATRTAIRVFDAPQPVVVFDESRIRDANPNTIADLFRTQAGLDVTGVGANQARPSIRGQRGQRILLLEDGMRLSNSRRQQDFGELPALIDVSAVQRVEVVRGPASVLYGSDAIGGVVNMITRVPDEEGMHGSGGYRYGSADNQNKGHASLFGRFGKLSFIAGGSYRSADTVYAPAGTYGDITLDSRTAVFDTDLNDYSVNLYLGYEVAEGQRLYTKFESYDADTTGFGWVDPDAFDPSSPRIQIRYPFQDYRKYTVGYEANSIGTPVADGVSIVGYHQSNQRELANDIFIPFGSPTMGMNFSSVNYTDISTVGARLEASKFAWGRVNFTYGADFSQDDTDNTDFSVTSFMGFPPQPPFLPDTSLAPNVPNASFRSLGAFVQGDIEVTPWASLILGARYQNIHAATKTTPLFTGDLNDQTNDAFVGAANAIVDITDQFTLIGTVGSAFRAPNIIEQFFEGPTPEGSGFQSRNPDLRPEKSFNVDFGVRYRDSHMFLEGFVFRNMITDGIRIIPTGDSVGGFFEVRNDNVDKLRFMGLELSGDVVLPAGFSLGANFTYFDTEDVSSRDPGALAEAQSPVGDSYSSKIGGTARYTYPTGLFFVEYEVRHNGDRRDAFCPLESLTQCDADDAFGREPVVGEPESRAYPQLVLREFAHDAADGCLEPAAFERHSEVAEASVQDRLFGRAVERRSSAACSHAAAFQPS